MNVYHIKGIFAALALSSMATLQAQDIAIVSPSNIHIPDGAGSSYVLNTTFPDQWVDQYSGYSFAIVNDSLNATLTVSSITVTGANAGDFTITPPDTMSVNPQSREYFAIGFEPSALGTRTATINVFSNDPDSEDTYTFDVDGQGVESKPQVDPDVEVYGNIKPVKVKFNKGKSLYKVSGKVDVRNTGFVPITAAFMEVFQTTKSYLDDSAVPVYQKTIKKIPLFNFQKDKFLKLPFKFTTPDASGSIYVRISPIFPSTNDVYWYNNVSQLSYPAP